MPNPPAISTARWPRGPGTCSLDRSDPDTLVFGPARATPWPSLAKLGLGGRLAVSTLLGVLLLSGCLLWLLIIGGALVLPIYWGSDALGRGDRRELAFDVALEVVAVALLALAALAISSGGRWVTFDRKRDLMTVMRRPFGWRRAPRVVDSRSLHGITAVQVVYGGVAEEVLSISPYDDRMPPITREYDWYEFSVVFRDPGASDMSLASGPDWAWMRQAARELSEFLGVPLVDYLYHAKPAPSA